MERRRQRFVSRGGTGVPGNGAGSVEEAESYTLLPSDSIRVVKAGYVESARASRPIVAVHPVPSPLYPGERDRVRGALLLCFHCGAGILPAPFK